MSKHSLSNEAKVGGLIVGTVILAVIFAWVIGVQSPFNRSVDYYVTYNFAGGVEVGSPVRVSGIKVGKVEKIEFFVPSGGQTVGIKEPGSSDEVATATDPDAKSVVPLRENVVRFSQEQYDAMLLGVYQLLQAKQAEFDAYREYIEALRDYWIARSDLERAVGAPLTPPTP